MGDRVTSESLSDVVRRLAGAQKTAKGSPFYSRFVNRKAGRYFAAVAYKLGLTPNAVTGISAMFTLAAIVLIFLLYPSIWMGFAVALLLAIGYALDSADGQLARLRGGGSPVGEWLDHVVDSAKLSSLHLAVLVSYYRFGYREDPHVLAVPLVWCFLAPVVFFMIILNDQIRRAHGTTAPMTTSASVVRSILVAPTDYGVLLVIFAVFGWRELFLVLYGVLLVLNIVHYAMAGVRWYREFRSLATAENAQ